MANSYPNVNGFEYSFASIELKIGAQRYFGATAINYDDGLQPGMATGTSTLPLGWTAGQWTGTASIEFNRRDGQAIIDALGDGFGRVPLAVTVQYAEEGMPVITDSLPLCRIQKVANGNNQGTDPSKMSFDLSLLKPILRNGKAIERAIENLTIASV